MRYHKLKVENYDYIYYYLFYQTKNLFMNNPKNILVVNSTLKSLYPEAMLELKYNNGFELLIAVILSAQCTDERVNMVTENLFQKYQGPRDYLNIPIEELEQDIKPTGFYRNKTKSLRACCQKLIDEFGGDIPQQIDQMIKLPGVGRKTAAMVLGNAYRINQGISVDTHVARVVKRLALSHQTKTDKIEQELMNLLPQKDWTQFSNAMILFGRRICQARKPKCEECPYREWCPSPDKIL